MAKCGDEVPGGLAERGVLLQAVAQVRVERGVGRGVEVAARQADDGVVAGRRQVLAVVAVHPLEEPADQPLEHIVVGRGEAQLLGYRVQGGAVVQRRVGAHVRLDVRVGIPEDVVGDAAGELRGIAQHAHVAVGVGSDRGQRRGAEVVVELQVRQRELIAAAPRAAACTAAGCRWSPAPRWCRDWPGCCRRPGAGSRWW